MLSRWSLLLLVPQLLSAQTVCGVMDGMSVVQVSDNRGWFVDKQLFEQELIAAARIKLIQQSVGSNVQQTFHVYQEGSRTVHKTVQSSTYQVAQATLTNECYHITYNGRTATITLSATPRPRTDVNIVGPRIPTIPRSQPTVRNPHLVSKISWAIGYIILYVYSSQ